VYQFRKGISAGPALKYFTRCIGAGGKIEERREKIEERREKREERERRREKCVTWKVQERYRMHLSCTFHVTHSRRMHHVERDVP